MKKKVVKVILLVFLVQVQMVFSQDTTSTIVNGVDIFDLTLEELLGLNVTTGEQKDFRLYGFMQANVERVLNEPFLDGNGNTITHSDPPEWSPVKDFHIYGSGHLSPNIDILFNIAAPGGENFEIRNAWGNFKLKDILQVRVGKMYRKFGLYNEKLDQIPTFVGIEPPELFDIDHLFLTRTTDFMIHGEKEVENGSVSYALTHDNGEGGPKTNVIPLGWDFRFKSDELGIIIGTSGYTSSITQEKSSSTVSFNSGSPRGGILPWMDGDHFTVTGGFVEKKIGRFLIQSEYWVSNHSAIRNRENTLELVKNAGINTTQRANFLGANTSKNNTDLTVNDVVANVNYTAQTFYIRVAYTIDTEKGQFVPYVFFDWMSNPELIRNKNWGGDDEAGMTDDGKFIKPSIGLVYRPIPVVAIKLDGSIHSQKFNGETVVYPEFRLDFSFSFDALKGL